MKSIGIVTDSNSEVATFLENNLQLVFDKHVLVNKHYLNELQEGYEIKDDVVLVMIEEQQKLPVFVASLEDKGAMQERLMGRLRRGLRGGKNIWDKRWGN